MENEQKNYRALTTISDVANGSKQTELFFETISEVDSYVRDVSDELGLNPLFGDLDEQLFYAGDYVEIRKSLTYLGKNLGIITILITQLENSPFERI